MGVGLSQPGVGGPCLGVGPSGASGACALGVEAWGGPPLSVRPAGERGGVGLGVRVSQGRLGLKSSMSQGLEGAGPGRPRCPGRLPYVPLREAGDPRPLRPPNTRQTASSLGSLLC